MTQFGHSTPRTDRRLARLTPAERAHIRSRSDADLDHAAAFRRGTLSSEKRRAELQRAIGAGAGMVGRAHWVRAGLYGEHETPSTADLARQDALDRQRSGETGRAVRYRAAVVVDTRPGEALVDRSLGTGGNPEWVPLSDVRGPLTADEVRAFVPDAPETRDGRGASTHSAVRPGFAPFRE